MHQGNLDQTGTFHHVQTHHAEAEERRNFHHFRKAVPRKELANFDDEQNNV